MYHLNSSFFTVLSLLLLLVIVFFSIFRIRTVYDFQRGVLFVFGRFKEILGPGSHLFFRLTQNITVLDIRPTIQVISGQELVTSDGISLKVSLAVTYEIVDPRIAIIEAEDYKKAIHLALQVAIREIIAPIPVDEVLSKRSEFAAQLMTLCSAKFESFGVKLIQAEVRDLTFSAEVKTIFAQVVKARKVGQAALEKARGESAALRSLANSAKMIEGNPALLQLRTLHAIAESQNATVVMNIQNIEGSSIKGPCAEPEQGAPT
jgi:regulator of protease activity HflC (stomatin/prohibitin superfamily)